MSLSYWCVPSKDLMELTIYVEKAVSSKAMLAIIKQKKIEIVEIEVAVAVRRLGFNGLLNRAKLKNCRAAVIQAPYRFYSSAPTATHRC